MKRTKIISSLLSLSLLAALVVPGTLSQPVVEAADKQEQENEGMEVNKYAEANDDGTYTITLEAYATGEKITTEVTKEIPTDIVLVLDQSGSMDEPMTTISFRKYSDTWYETRTSNEFYYSMRANQDYERNKNLWYQPEGSNEYYSVSVVRTEGSLKYTLIERGMNNSSGGWGGEYTNYYQNRNNLYALVDGEYQKVTVLQEWKGIPFLGGDYEYTYTLPSGEVIATSFGNTTSPEFTGIDGGELYLLSADETTREYTYTYTDASGREVKIGTSEGDERSPEFGPFYEQYEDDETSRLEALKNAVESFVDSVSSKAAGADGIYETEDDIDHRIAVVGFASSRSNYNYEPYENTELFIGSSQYNYDDNASDNDASNYYGQALQDMSSANGRANIKDSIDEISAYGGTYPQHGMAMVNGIFNANPVDEGETRNRVVVMFTDGWPGNGDYVNMTEAQATVNAAATAKRIHQATVYTVGIFDGADPTDTGSSEDRASNNDKANWFMQNVSSNNGTPQDPGYYLSAADADTLNDIFEQIADEIEEGGASTTLDKNAVIQDIIAPSFTLPEGTNTSDILLETYSYVGENMWEKNPNAMGASATINDDTVSVTGFDFADNWCGTEEVNGETTYRGNKLVISFDVVPKDGFLGGNNVPTNTSAGVYENAATEEPVFTFPVPEANVPIKDVTVEAEDKNVYLLGALTAEQIKSGDTVMCGNVTLDLADDNYGLQTWQNDYVDITVTYKDTEGEILTDLKDLTEDATYTVEVTIKPKESGEDAVGTPNSSIGETASDEGSINVFKPELTFTDGEVWYGGDAPDDYSDYLETERWKHKDTLSNSVQMTGDEPKLELAYTPESGKITNGKIDTKDDISVDVAVKIGGTDVTEDTVFVHTSCEGKECSKPEDGAFWLHVNTCQLTITKQGGAEDEPYVFTVLKDNAIYTSLTIEGNGEVTIKELPVGRYSIEEDEKWSWRYNGTEGAAVTLSSSNPYGTISCENVKDENTWLNDYSSVVENVYGEKQTVVNE